jgi:hypothetical protein
VAYSAPARIHFHNIVCRQEQKRRTISRKYKVVVAGHAIFANAQSTSTHKSTSVPIDPGCLLSMMERAVCVTIRYLSTLWHGRDNIMPMPRPPISSIWLGLQRGHRAQPPLCQWKQADRLYCRRAISRAERPSLYRQRRGCHCGRFWHSRWNS